MMGFKVTRVTRVTGSRRGPAPGWEPVNKGIKQYVER